MNINRSCEACRLFVMVLVLHALMSVTGRPHGNRKPSEVPSWTTDMPVSKVTDVELVRSRVPRTALGKDEDESAIGTFDCQEVSQRQLWLRLDSVQNNNDRSIAHHSSATPIATIVASTGLEHSHSALSHSKRSQEYNKQHSATDAGTVELTSTNGLRHRHRTRRQADKRQKLKRAKRAKRKFLKRISRTKNMKKIEKMLFDDDKQWQCSFKEVWELLGDHYFPEYVRTGKCAQKECMFGFYTCKEKRYMLPVLRRLGNQCNPIPALGTNTQYEEAWVEDHVSVVVGCECSSLLS